MGRALLGKAEANRIAERARQLGDRRLDDGAAILFPLPPPDPEPPTLRLVS